MSVAEALFRAIEPFRERIWLRKRPATQYPGGKGRLPEAGRRFLLAPHGPPVCGNVPVVLFHGVGEAVMAGGIGDEVVVVALRGMHDCFK